jgi:hypothetical protein
MNQMQTFLNETGAINQISERLATILIEMHEPGANPGYETPLHWKQIKLINKINEEFKQWKQIVNTNQPEKLN